MIIVFVRLPPDSKVHCPACLQFFHSRERVIRHVEEKSPRCRAVLLQTFVPLPAQVIAELDAIDAVESRSLRRQGRRRHYAESVTSRLLGPLCQEAYVAGINHANLLRGRLSLI